MGVSTGLAEGIRILQHRDILEAIARGDGVECPPVHVRIEPTESCNFKCSFCWWHADDRRAALPMFDFNGRRRLNLDRLLRLIDELADLGTKALSFTGAGDPLVFPGMDQVLRRIRERGMRFAVTSNLAMPLSDALIAELAHAAWVRWSMNAGTSETYVRVNNPRGADAAAAFDRVQDNVRRLSRARRVLRRRQLNASFVVYVTNGDDVLAGARLAKELGADSISFRPDTPFERQREPNCYRPEVERDILRAQRELETDAFKVYMNVDRAEDTMKLGDPDLVCFYSNHTTYIAATGDVYPCCYTRHDVTYAIGNILELSFSEFWRGEKRRSSYRKLFFDTCPPCPYGKTNQALKLAYSGAVTARALHVPAAEQDEFL